MKLIRPKPKNKYYTEGLKKSIAKSKKKGKEYKPEKQYLNQFKKIGKHKPQEVKDEIDYISKKAWRR